MLKMTGIELELISDIKMHFFIEKGMREGIPCIAKRYSKANNKCMTDYGSSEESRFIIYLDTNTLYVWARSIYLPSGKFTWLSQKEINNFDVDSIIEDSPDAYILEVDLEYPDELRDLLNDYPLAREKLKISNDVLPKYCSEIVEKCRIKVGGVNKLVPNLGNKSKYVVHYRNLQLSLGMKLTKIHRVLKFKQSDWLKTYIDFNTDKKKMLLIVLKKIFLKQMINNVYGKTM